MHFGGALHACAVEAEPDPEHPFGDCDGRVFAVAVLGFGEPVHGEQEAAEAPAGEDCEEGEVGHHGAEGDEEHVLGHEAESETR